MLSNDLVGLPHKPSVFFNMSVDNGMIDGVLRHLPQHELQRYLFKRLDFETLLSARCVNKLWQTLVDPLLDFHVDLSDKNKKYVVAFGTARKVSTLTTTVFQGKYPPQGLSVDINMLRVTVNFNDEDPNMRIKNDQRINIGLSDYNFQRLVHDFYYVEKFHITSLAVRAFRKPILLSKVHLPNVKEMIITFFDSGFHQLMPFMYNSFPKLRAVNIANVAEVRMDRPCLYTRIFGFIARHQSTLDEVTLIFPEGIMDADDSPVQSSVYRQLRRDHKMPSHMYETVKLQLGNMRLNKFIWDVSMLEGTARYDLGLTILRSQTRITELLLDNLHTKDQHLWSTVGKVLENCSSTLTSVTLGGCMCGPPALGPNVFSCTWLKNCVKLENLEMVICGMFVDGIESLPVGNLRTLNLGHMLHQNQIEYIALHMINLESWVLPQRGCKVNILVPKINRYLFEVILHLPKLSRLNILSECADKTKIMEFVETQEGIRRCSHMCMDFEKNGNLGFHICRKSFQLLHSQLSSFIENHRTDMLREMDLSDGEVVEFFIRNLILGNNVYLER